MNTINYQTYFFTPLLGYGKEANVFAISPNHAVKVPHRVYTKDESEEHFRSTLEKHVLFYHEGISVPKAEGIIEVNIRHGITRFGFKHGRRVGLIMERLYGQRGSDLVGNLKDRIETLYDIEADKAWKLGYLSYEGLFNSVYVPAEDKLYLVDLMEWKHVSECSSILIQNYEENRHQLKKERIKRKLTKAPF